MEAGRRGSHAARLCRRGAVRATRKHSARSRSCYSECLMVGKMWRGKAARRAAVFREIGHHLVPPLFEVAVTHSGNCQRANWHNRHQAMAFPRRIDDVEIAVVLNRAGVGVFGFRLTT